jgi:hypothetical protein
MKEDLPVLLAIDPSVRNLGWCCVNLNKGTDLYDIESEVWDFGLVEMRSENKGVNETIIKFRWRKAYQVLLAALEAEGNEPTHFAAEWPNFFNDIRGRIAAQQGYTLGLASMVGYLAGQFNFRANNITLWTPFQWKGNMSKDVTKERFKLTFGKPAHRLARQLSDDVIDAIMIAKYWLTLYDRKKFRWQYEEKEVVSYAAQTRV